MSIESYPLHWPDGWKRSKHKEKSMFSSTTVAKSTAFILHELRLMNSKNIIISTNVSLRLYGLPYSNQRDPSDCGASVWWTDSDGNQKTIALDKYIKVADNLRAIGKTIEAMRGIERWGGGEILNRTFAGFTALPDLNTIDWWDVLRCKRDSSFAVVEAQYKRLRSDNHPDKGGSDEKFHSVKTAYEKYRNEPQTT